MKRLIILICIFSLGCNILSHRGFTTLQWNEKGLDASNSVTPGIPAYNGVVVDYLRQDKHILKVKLYDPVVVSVASKPEKWGYFQFPTIYRSVDNTLVATWNMAADAVESYGHGGRGYAVSKDGGKSWTPTEGDIPIGGGLILPDGDRIKIFTPSALKVDSLHLPSPISKEVGRRKFTFYRINQLPASLQGVYIQRLPKGETKWISEHATLNDSMAVRYSESGLFPVVWWGDMQVAPDRSIITGIYPGFKMGDYNEVTPSGVFFYRSTDDGHTWNVQGRIPYTPDLSVDSNGNKRINLGYTEPAFIILSNGIFLCVMRTTDGFGNSPMYLSYSKDEGVSWSVPKPFTSNGVLPRLLQLGNGVIVLSSGRPGVQLRFSLDGKGDEWTDPFEMLPYKEGEGAVSCGYTGLLATGKNSFLIIYSDFEYQNKKGAIRKAIKVREVEVTPNQ
ncbi:MAG: exo-alpha-sialidase [Chitinophagaceae bacterium]|nr:MAG: exo-alpha-sialidase [Chitinophagaceae bacterium]